LRRVPRDLYPDARRRPLFAQRFARQGSLPHSAALHLPPPSRPSLKGSIVKIQRGCRKSPTVTESRATPNGGLQLSARYSRNEPPHLQSSPLRPISRDNKGKYIRDVTLRRSSSTSLLHAIAVIANIDDAVPRRCSIKSSLREYRREARIDHVPSRKITSETTVIRHRHANLFMIF